MKVLVETEDSEGMDSLAGKNVLLLCANYFYAGKLTGINTECVKLENAGIVYDTGGWDGEKFSNFQKLPPFPVYIQKDSIESFTETDKL